MKKMLAGILMVGLAVVILLAVAPGPKTYQVTGKITAMTDTVITVQKSNQEVWEVARTADLAVSGGTLAVGAKVTIIYKMVGVSAEIKK
jgi:hypothetical protein